MMPEKADYETVIGLEVHVKLKTATKIFCGCASEFGSRPNINTCPVCTGMPGTLPVLNKKVVELACLVGLAMDCEISHESRFDRKNYFYPDNPQNYQISQLYMPLCKNGYIDIEKHEGEKKRIRIKEIHMEDDAGKLIHDEEKGITLIDYNRSGIPLIEIVTEPDLSDGDEVTDFLEILRLRIQYLSASDCRLNEGSMRVDVNLSVKKQGEHQLGVRTEMKNLNSFKAIKRAVESEKKRQIQLLESGKKVQMQTRRWDDVRMESFAMREKEEAKDYRYFPEPDLPSVRITDEWLLSLKKDMPEFREAKRERYISQYSLSYYDADILTSEKHITELFEETLELCHDPKSVSNWMTGELLRLCRERGMTPDEVRFSPKHLAELIELLRGGRINIVTAKEIFVKLFDEDISPAQYVEKTGLSVIGDEEEIEAVVRTLASQNEKIVTDYKSGKKKAKGALVGLVMKHFKGKADPVTVNEIVEKILEG